MNVLYIYIYCCDLLAANQVEENNIICDTFLKHDNRSTACVSVLRLPFSIFSHVLERECVGVYVMVCRLLRISYSDVNYITSFSPALISIILFQYQSFCSHVPKDP